MVMEWRNWDEWAYGGAVVGNVEFMAVGNVGCSGCGGHRVTGRVIVKGAIVGDIERGEWFEVGMLWRERKVCEVREGEEGTCGGIGGGGDMRRSLYGKRRVVRGGVVDFTVCINICRFEKVYKRDEDEYYKIGDHGFVGYPFDYRVTLGFGSIAGGLDHVNPIIRLPLKHKISRLLDTFEALKASTSFIFFHKHPTPLPLLSGTKIFFLLLPGKHFLWCSFLGGMYLHVIPILITVVNWLHPILVPWLPDTTLDRFGNEDQILLMIAVTAIEKLIRRLSLVELEIATNQFDNRSIIGYGNMGIMYKAVFPDGVLLAVKMLHEFDSFEREYFIEINILGRLQQTNLIPLLGFCYAREKKFLLYKYMNNGSLHQWLHCKSQVDAKKMG
ncbi:kinase-like domain-containing protein [Tanacetum coccineum]